MEAMGPAPQNTLVQVAADRVPTLIVCQEPSPRCISAPGDRPRGGMPRLLAPEVQVGAVPVRGVGLTAEAVAVEPRIEILARSCIDCQGGAVAPALWFFPMPLQPA